MIFGYTMMAIAITISAIAAWYSIAGLTAIFAAAVVPVIIMGGALEAGKIVATVWLHNNWQRAGWLYKTYLVPAIVFLMLLTSMGIFGFLSKAHSDQSLVSGDAMSKIAIYDEKITAERDNITAAKKALEQMNNQVDQMLGRTDSDKGAERAVSIRRGQARERASLQAEITKAQKNIQKLQEERAPLAAEFRKVEAEVGPIKYIAAFVYGDNPDQNILERAVRWVIILIVIVFDPLALCLVLASNKQLEWGREDKEKQFREISIKLEPNSVEHTESEPEEPKKFNPDDLAVTPEEEELFSKLESNIEPEPTEVTETVDHGNCPKCKTKLIDVPAIGLFCPNKQCDVADGYKLYEEVLNEYQLEEPKSEEVVELKIDTTEHQSVDPEPLPVDDFEPKSLLPEVNTVVEETPEPTVETEGVTTEAYKNVDGEYIEFEGKHMHKRVLRGTHPELFALRADDENGISTGFGTRFPETAVTSDIFVRVDVLPNRVYKFNRNKWIEISKESSDSYLYNNKYMEFLVDKIATGEIDPDILTPTEQAMVEQYIKKSVRNG